MVPALESTKYTVWSLGGINVSTVGSGPIHQSEDTDIGLSGEWGSDGHRLISGLTFVLRLSGVFPVASGAPAIWPLREALILKILRPFQGEILIFQFEGTIY